jgi:hypothetical protein
MTYIMATQPRLPGTMEGLLATTIEALAAVNELDEAAAELGRLMARLERYFAGDGGDTGTLLYDTRDAARMLDLMRGRIAPLVRRFGAA